MTGRTWRPSIGQTALAGILTFTIPAAQWLIGKTLPALPYRGIISSLLILLCLGGWYVRRTGDIFLPASTLWKASVYGGSLVILFLLAIDIWNAPVAKITGQARSPFEVIDVIMLVPIAEEWIFRGTLWSLFERKYGKTVPLILTSLLFGVEHLGYWAQAGWPLPPQAFLHALSMVGAGLCFGAFRWKSGSLAVPTAAHMLANGILLLAQ